MSAWSERSAKRLRLLADNINERLQAGVCTDCGNADTEMPAAISDHNEPLALLPVLSSASPSLLTESVVEFNSVSRRLNRYPAYDISAVSHWFSLPLVSEAPRSVMR